MSTKRRSCRSKAWTVSMMSFASTPYAPMFCTALAPTSPGISDRFSGPQRPSAAAQAQKSSKTTPAATVADFSARPSALVEMTGFNVIPWLAICSTVPGKSPVKRRLEPPPITKRGCGRASKSSVSRSSGSVTSTYKRQDTLIPKVFCRERSYASCLIITYSGLTFRAIWSSSSWTWSISDGESIITSRPWLFFGNAM